MLIVDIICINTDIRISAHISYTYIILASQILFVRERIERADLSLRYLFLKLTKNWIKNKTYLYKKMLMSDKM